MWQCTKCETLNNGEYCEVCGEKNIEFINNIECDNNISDLSDYIDNIETTEITKTGKTSRTFFKIIIFISTIISIISISIIMVVVIYYTEKNKINVAIDRIELISDSGIILDTNSLILKVGEQKKINFNITNTEINEFDILWRSSNSNIVSVNQGLLTALSEGTVNITAYNEKYSAVCNVTVESNADLENNTKENIKDYKYSINQIKSEINITGYTGKGEKIQIPSKIDGYTVTTINKYAFYECNSITSIIIPNTIIKISDSAFRKCDGITELNIPDSVKNIELYAFENCKNLKSVTIGNGIETIGESLFRNCTKLESILIPESIKTIDLYSFENCISLTSINIPSSVTKIGEAAFMNCKSLTQAKFVGDAPALKGSDIFTRTEKNFTIFFRPNSKGWTSPRWEGYRTKVIIE